MKIIIKIKEILLMLVILLLLTYPVKADVGSFDSYDSGGSSSSDSDSGWSSSGHSSGS